MSVPTRFVARVPHGTLVAVDLPGRDVPFELDAASELHEAERAHARALPPLRRVTFAGGRVALRRALAEVGAPVGTPILPDPRGAPALPGFARGSLSHKDRVAVALAAAGEGPRVGVDVEEDACPRRDVSRFVLTPEERAAIEALPDEARLREVLVRFSIKESIYKALDPFVRRYVGFHEVAVSPREGGAVTVTAALKHGEGPYLIEAWWARRDGLVLSTARVSPA